MDKKKMDPGWNDPPMLNYSPSNPPPKSRITNKRVAFPLSSNSTNTPQALPSESMPMPPKSSVLLPPLLNVLPTEKEANVLPDELFKKVKENFDKLEKDPRINQESIKLLFKLWEEEKFSVDCQNYIYLFSKHLVENNKVDAQRLKEKLLNELQNSCKQWLDNFEV